MIDPADLAAELIDIDSVQPFPGNPKKGDVEGIAASLGEYGQWRPLLIQAATRYIVAGNNTWRAAKLGPLDAAGIRHPWTAISAIVVDVDDSRAKQINLADNRWAERGETDQDALATWLKELTDAGANTDAMGYGSEDLDKLLAGLRHSETDADAAPPLPEPKDVWVRPGQLFALGRHRILCGDSTDPASYDRLFDGLGPAGMIWTDPPYGVAYQTKLSLEEATARHRRTDGLEVMNDGEDLPALKALITAFLEAAVPRVKPGGALYVASPSTAPGSVFLQALLDAGIYRQTIIWVKDVFVMGRQDYHWRHEPIHLGVRPGPFNVKGSSPIFYGWRPGAAHWFVDDRTMDTVWEIPRPRRSAEHPTMKPVELVERCILASSRRKDLILDPFLGSGTTIVAADRTARTGLGIELDPRYVQVAIERWQIITGGEATAL